MTRVIVVGNIVVDFIVKPERDLPKWGHLVSVDAPIRPNIGGNGAITATYLSKLIGGCSLVGRVGDDTLGHWFLDELGDQGLDTSKLKVGEACTGATAALVDQVGRRAFLHHIGANAELGPRSVPTKSLKGSDWLHFGGLFLLPKFPPHSCANLLKRAKKAGLYTSVDVSWDPEGGWDLDEVPKYADVFFFNRDEGEAITGTDAPLEMVEMISAKGPAITVLKMGDAGCCVKMKSGESFFAPSFDVKAIDSTGSGDAFNAGFILGMINTIDSHKGSKTGKKGKKAKKGKKGSRRRKIDILEIVDNQKLKKIALLGNAMGGICVSRIGGCTDPPSKRELLDFVKNRKKDMFLE